MCDHTLDELSTQNRVIGIRQSTRAVSNNSALHAFIAHDADENVKTPFLALCTKKKVNITWVDSMTNLGRACNIKLGASVAVILK